jgi:hypothetical protein
MFTINKKSLSISNVLGIISILLILIGIYFSLMMEAFFNILQFRNILYVLGVLLFTLFALTTGRINIKKDFFEYALLAIPILIISIFFWEKKADINLYIVLITTIAITGYNFEVFKKIILYLFIIIIVLAVYEYLTKNYIFSVIRLTEWGYLPQDEKFFGGYSKIFRAKSIFEGPLALAQFSMGIALLFKNNTKIILLSIVTAFLANGRLGIIITVLVLLAHLYSKYNISQFLSNKKIIILFFIVLIVGFYLISQLDEKSIDRLVNVINTKESGNSARIGYWKNAIFTFFNYDMLHVIFGNNGYYFRLYGNSTENGWLMLLVNNGLIGFFYYLFPLIAIMYYSAKFKTNHLFFILLLILPMTIQTFHLGASASLFYWIIIYSYLVELKEISIFKKNESDI